MNKISTKFGNFITEIPKDISRVELFEALSNWVILNERLFPKEEVYFKSLASLIKLNPIDFPIMQSDIDIREEIDRLIEFPPKSTITLAMRLRDILWQLISINVSVKVSSTKEITGTALWDEDNGQLVIESLDGSFYPCREDYRTTHSRLLPASIENLRSVGILPPLN